MIDGTERPYVEVVGSEVSSNTDNKSDEIKGESDVSNAANTNGASIDVIGWDLGFGDVKVTAARGQEIVRMYKYPSAIAPMQSSEYFQDSRAIKMGEHSYYVGDDALSQPTELIQDVVEYTHLETYLPLFMHKTLEDCGCSDEDYPAVVVIGLSVAHIKYSGHFKKKADDYFSSMGWEVDVFVVPQGVGVKMAADKYFVDYPSTQNSMRAMNATYMIADIGMNTLDVLMITDGQVTPNQVRGIEKRGAVVICARLQEHISKNYNRKLTLKEVKNVLDSGVYKLRGQQFDLSSEIAQMKRDYLKMIESLMEQEFGSVMDKVSFIMLSGGGAYFFSNHVEGNSFYHAPKAHCEYYNSIGFCSHGIKKLREKSSA